jgi:phosphate transport system permease protein
MELHRRHADLSGLAAVMAVPIGVVSGIYMSGCGPPVRRGGAVRRRYAQRRAVDRHRPLRLCRGTSCRSSNSAPRRRLRARADDDPIIARTTEELLLLVPGTMREGALALGATRARAVFSVVLPAALPGIVTGIVLALARIAGETAPLLFTAFNNRFFSTSLRQPISSLTVQVYTYATGPYEDWHRQAWAGALVLVSIVLICSLLARLATRRLERMHAVT